MKERRVVYRKTSKGTGTEAEAQLDEKYNRCFSVAVSVLVTWSLNQASQFSLPATRFSAFCLQVLHFPYLRSYSCPSFPVMLRRTSSWVLSSQSIWSKALQGTCKPSEKPYKHNYVRFFLPLGGGGGECVCATRYVVAVNNYFMMLMIIFFNFFCVWQMYNCTRNLHIGLKITILFCVWGGRQILPQPISFIICCLHTFRLFLWFCYQQGWHLSFLTITPNLPACCTSV